MKKRNVHQAVCTAYQVAARSAGEPARAVGCCGPGRCSTGDYSPEEVASVPEGAYLGEGSGVPTRYASLQPGEVVVDLGAGAGMDSFLAANAVGLDGRVYGFDLTPAMVQRARRNAAQSGYRNVNFRRADIAKLPLHANTADAVISNCVINLAPDKKLVFREIFRVTRLGGRLLIADIVLRGRSDAIRRYRQAAGPEVWVACVSGALREAEYLAAIRAAGFVGVKVQAERPAQLQPGNGVRAVAVTVTARKPA